jgi:hypothetical protein
MTKKRVGFILNAMVVAAIAVPALVSAAGNPLPAPPRKCDLRRCPPAKGPSVPVKVPVKAPVGK